MKRALHICLLAFMFLLAGQKLTAQCNLFGQLGVGYNCLLGKAYIVFTMSGGTAPYTCTLVSTANGATVATGFSATNTGTVQGLPVGFYNVFFVDANGCTYNISSYQIVVSYANSNIAVFSTSVTCNGGSNGGANAIPPNSFSGNMTYLWQPGGATTPSVSTLSAGIVYTVTINDSKGCVQTSTVSVIEPPPIESTLSNTYIVCFGATISSPITSTGNVGTTSYTLNGTALPANVASPLSAGIQTLITQDSKGCRKTNTIVVQQGGVQTVIGFSITKPSCPGKSDGAITQTVSSAPPSYSYTWQPGGSNAAGLSNIPTGNYTLSVLDGNGCTTRSVTAVLPAASATVTALTKAENCSAADGAFTLNVAGVSPPFTFTTWPTGTSTGSVVNNLVSGSYTAITVYNTTCVDTLRFSIGNLSPVIIAVQNSVAVKCYSTCTGSVLLNVQNAVGLVTYSASGLPLSNSNLINNFCAGFYVIRAVDANGCPATTTVNFATPPVFTYSAQAPASACSGQGISLQGFASGGSGGYTYIWNPGNINGQVVSTTPAGTTVYSLNVYDSNGCTQTPVQVTINVQPQISVNINSSNSGICPGTTAQITPTVSGGDGNYNYLWLPGNSTGASIFVENITVPVYTLFVSDACGSPPVTRFITINLFPVIQPLYTTKSSKGCEPFCTTFTNITPNSSNVTWNYGDRPFEQTGDVTNYCYQKAGTYNLWVSLTDSNNCKTSFTYSNAIRVLASPKADFISQPARITLKTAENVLVKNTTVNGNSYEWIRNGKLIGETEDIYYTFADTGCYRFTLIAKNLNNCMDTLDKDLCVKEDFNFFMPNCFTPNDNGLNDVLIPQGTGWLSKNYQFEIYNRWGNRLFKTTDITSGWDGTNADKTTPFNSFIWRVVITDIQDIEHVFSGPVTIVR